MAGGPRRAWGDEIRVEPEAYFDVGEQPLLFHVLRGRGQHSGVEVALPGAGLFRWSDGLLVHLKAHAHREDALTDLGASEDELEPISPSRRRRTSTSCARSTRPGDEAQ